VQIPLPSATKSTCWEATIAATMAAAMRPARITEVAFRVLRTGTCKIVGNRARRKRVGQGRVSSAQG